MKKLITISLFIFPLISFTQTSGSRIFRDSVLKEDWRYSIQDSMSIRSEYTDTITSPNKNYKIIMRAVSTSDNVTKLEYWLVVVNSKTKLMSALTHDLPSPNFFWIGDNYLLYEMWNNYEPIRIILHNLQNNKTEVDTPGSISVPQKYGDEFYDPINNVFIFYKTRNDSNRYKTDIMKLELNSKSVQYLGTLKADDYLSDNFSYPLISMDWADRKLQLNYHDIDKEYNEEIKY